MESLLVGLGPDQGYPLWCGVKGREGGGKREGGRREGGRRAVNRGERMRQRMEGKLRRFIHLRINRCMCQSGL